MKIINEIKDFVEYVRKYKENTKELDDLDRSLDLEKSKTFKLKKELEEIKIEKEIFDEKQNDYILAIKENRKEIRKLKKENNFLTERENKLQQIEMLITKQGALKKIKEVIMEYTNE